jgi:cell division protein FtsW
MALLKCFDPWLFFVVFLLVLFGVLMVGSSTCYLAMQEWNDPSVLYWRQGLHAVVGFVALLVAMRMPYAKLGGRPVLIAWFFCCAILLLVVFTMPPLGGARRWILLGPVRFQPSEMVKLFVVVYMASVLARKQERINEPRVILVPCLVVVGTPALLILVEPDLGSVVVLVMVTVIMLFVAGLRAKYLATIGALGVLGLASAVVLYPFRVRRLVEFFRYVLGLDEPSYQLRQSLIAIGSGGVTGVGFGQGRQKAFFLPASHTDFIYSIVGEELGLIGTVPLLAAFLVIFWRGTRTTKRVREPFGAYLALGLTSLIVGQFLMHAGVCLGMLPATGLTLPFVSYGGSSLVASMAAMGLLINVSQECHPAVE